MILLVEGSAGLLKGACPVAEDVTGRAALTIPEDFPSFEVPGEQRAMDLLRELYFLHYGAAGPKATLWDEWLPSPSLWPATMSTGQADEYRRRWAEALSTRQFDPEGYVATHQHASMAHQQGWPFPWYSQIPDGTEVGSWGWHFGAVPPGRWHKIVVRTQEGWQLAGGVDRGIADEVWNIEFTEANATLQTPDLKILAGEQAPFVQLRWRAKGLDNAQPYLEWATSDEPEFDPGRRMHFDPISEADGMVHTMIPVYRCPTWRGRVTRLRIGFGNPPEACPICGVKAAKFVQI